MIKSKKIIVALFAGLFTISAFAQTISFSNKVSSDVVEIGITEDGTSVDFAGIKNYTTAEYTSKKLNIGLKMSFWAFNGEDTVLNKTYPYLAVGQKGNVYGIGWNADDYWIEFRPVELVGIGFHKAYNVAGSYLPVEDSEIDASNIGSDFGVFIRPIENLTFGAGLDFVSVFGGYDDYHANPYLNTGVEYVMDDVFGFGVSFRNFINDSRSIGIYASFMAIDNIVINAGFTLNGEFADVSGNLISVGFMFEKDELAINADLVFDVDADDHAGLDFYTGAEVSYQISAPLTIGVVGTFKNDFEYEDGVGEHVVFGINPYVNYRVNKHNVLSAGINIEIADDTAITLPVYWKYTL